MKENDQVRNGLFEKKMLDKCEQNGVCTEQFQKGEMCIFSLVCPFEKFLADVQLQMLTWKEG